MSEENISQEFTLENINKTRNDLIEEIIQNELRSQRHRKVYRAVTYVNFYCYWMRVHFYFCFLGWYSYSSYEFCNRIKNLCSKCRN